MSTMAADTNVVDSDESYIVFENLIRDRIAANESPLFATSATPEALWAAYLDSIPAARRQHYNCHACRRFVQTYGGLVKIDQDGTIRSLLWHGDEEVPPFFLDSVHALKSLIAGSKVTGVFLSDDAVWGTIVTRYEVIDGKKHRIGPLEGAAAIEWSHLSGQPRKPFKHSVLNDSQVAAEKLEDYKMLVHALADYKPPEVEQALRVLRADAVTRSEKALAIAEWFAKRQGEDANQRWLAVATAPPGFCHVRSTMISTLLDDIKAGLDFAEISRRWAEKMHPLQYQRPTAAPSDGAIEAAEKLVEKLGLAPALERKFADLDDVLAKLWTPRERKQAPKADGGVFGHLKQTGGPVKEVELPATRMTWEKFTKTVLDGAHSIEILVPSHGHFYGLTTATNKESPPLLQWDGLEGLPRNQASTYIYVNGSPASRWGLSSGWSKVNAVFMRPAHWQRPEQFKHHGKTVHFAIEGSHDSQTHGRGLAIFPENVRNELHGVRAVIEAHSKKGTITGQGTANGLMFSDGAEVTVRVDGSATYIVDRFD